MKYLVVVRPRLTAGPPLCDGRATERYRERDSLYLFSLPMAERRGVIRRVELV